MNTQMDRLHDMHKKVFARFLSSTSKEDMDMYYRQLDDIENDIFDLIRVEDPDTTLADVRYFTRESSSQK